MKTIAPLLLLSLLLLNASAQEQEPIVLGKGTALTYQIRGESKANAYFYGGANYSYSGVVTITYQDIYVVGSNGPKQVPGFNISSSGEFKDKSNKISISFRDSYTSVEPNPRIDFTKFNLPANRLPQDFTLLVVGVQPPDKIRLIYDPSPLNEPKQFEYSYGSSHGRGQYRRIYLSYSSYQIETFGTVTGNFRIADIQSSSFYDSARNEVVASLDVEIRLVKASIVRPQQPETSIPNQSSKGNQELTTLLPLPPDYVMVGLMLGSLGGFLVYMKVRSNPSRARRTEQKDKTEVRAEAQGERRINAGEVTPTTKRVQWSSNRFKAKKLLGQEQEVPSDGDKRHLSKVIRKDVERISRELGGNETAEVSERESEDKAIK